MAFFGVVAIQLSKFVQQSFFFFRNFSECFVMLWGKWENYSVCFYGNGIYGTGFTWNFVVNIIFTERLDDGIFVGLLMLVLKGIQQKI